MPGGRALIPLCLTLGLGLAILPGPARSDTDLSGPRIDVAGPQELAQALQTAGAGSVLVLAGGEYGALVAKGITGAADAPVVLRSADPADPARFSGMELRKAGHLVLEGLVFDYTFTPGDKLHLRPFQILDSRDITIRGALFDGDKARGVSPVDDGFGFAFGLGVTDVEGFTLEGSEIRDFFRGIVVSESDGITVQGNELHTIRMDGMNFAQVRNVRIEDNRIHGFNRSLNSKDHADMIQFWTNGTTAPSSNIVIRGNVLNSAHGWYTQSIFMRNDLVDRGLAGQEMFYRNITIEDNVIINAHLHGITVGETEELVIRHNTVVRNAASQGETDDPGLWTPRISVSAASRNVRIENNVTGEVVGPKGQADWKISNNFLIQDRFPTRPGYYDRVFVAARTGDAANLASFAYLPGGPLDGTGIGAARLGALPPPEAITPQIRVEGVADTMNRFRFDARHSAGPAAALAGAAFAWDFGDGTTATGPVAEHVYAKPGGRTVTLTLTAADGATHRVETTLAVPGPEVLDFDAATGRFTAWAAGEGRTVHDGPPGPVTLGQGLPPIEIDRGDIAPFFGARDFTLALRLRAEGRQAAGEVLRIHTALQVHVTGRGGVEMRLDTDSGAQIRLATGPLRLLDGAWHDIRLGYSATSGRAWIEVNGQTLAEARGQGVLKPMMHWGLALGNPFGKGKSFDGALEGLHLQANAEAFAEAR